MLDPRTIMLAMPCYDCKMMAETAGMLAQCGRMFSAIHLPSECSHVSLVRNIIAGNFLQSNFEWLVCVDSDISFRKEDLEYLLEPCDTAQHYIGPEEGLITDEHLRLGALPRPTRTTVAQLLDLAIPDSRTVAAADVLVCAEYSYKDDELAPVRFGMGFTRIHRSVFETLANMKHDGGPTVEVRRDLLEELEDAYLERESIGDQPGDPNYGVTPKTPALGDIIKRLIETRTESAGTARLWQCSHKGRLYSDFFPSGPLISQFLPQAEWKGEDHGFFTLCMLAGIVPRVETRTRLVHIGRKGYPYLGPDVGGGQ